MTLSTKSFTPKAGEIQRQWRVVDATDRPLGRLASEVAQILKGKDKPIYTPHMDTGDFVIVVNAAKVRITGDKLRQKMYYSHSMYPGGFKSTSMERLLVRHPRRVVEEAVWGMLPKNRLGRALMGKLKVYAEESHPHGAQIKEYARPEKAGRPGKPRPPRKVRVRPQAAEPQMGEATPAAPLEPAPELAPLQTPEPIPQPVESVAPVEEPAEEARPAVEGVPEEATAGPLTPPPRRSRSRQARAGEAREATSRRSAPKAKEPRGGKPGEEAKKEDA